MVFFRRHRQSLRSPAVTVRLFEGGEKLLAQSPFSETLTSLKQIVSATELAFQTLYIETLQRFAEMTQRLPADKDNDDLLFTQQLIVAMAALRLAKGQFVPRDATPEARVSREPRWHYGIFTAELLRRLEKRQHECDMELIDHDEKLILRWSPLWANVMTTPAYYRWQWRNKKAAAAEEVYFLPDSVYLTALALRILPPAALQWLMEDTSLAKTWWESVLNPTDTINEINGLLQQAEEKIGYCKISEKVDVATSNEEIISVPSSTITLLTTAEILQLVSTQWQQQPVLLNTAFYRIEPGLFLTHGYLLTLANFYQVTIETLLTVLKDEQALFMPGEKILHTYRAQDFTVRQRLEGLIVLPAALPPLLAELAVTELIQPEITVGGLR